jgi:hypothetical protein
VRRALAAWFMATALGAQEPAFTPRVQAGWRTDVLFGSPAAGELGAGINVPVGYYVRVGLDAGAGVARLDDRAVPSARADLAVRYLLDPVREFRWGPYAGGGLTTRWTDRAGWRASLLALVGIEGPESHGWRTSVEVGAGGGLRLGVVFRRARRNGR